MLTITNNQQTPNFRAQVKMKNSSAKIGQYLKNKGINPNTVLLTSAGTVGVAGTVAMFSPDAISAPDAAKWFISGGMTSTLGLMGFSNLKPKSVEVKAKTERIEAKKSARLTRWKKVVTPFKNYCQKHYNLCTRGILCIVGSTAVALDIVTAASCTDLGWTIPAILTGFTVYQGIMYKLGKKYYNEN